jgi:hypothetical protein
MATAVRGGGVATGPALLRRHHWFAQMVGGWSEGRSVEDGGEGSRFNGEEDGAERDPGLVG